MKNVLIAILCFVVGLIIHINLISIQEIPNSLIGALAISFLLMFGWGLMVISPLFIYYHYEENKERGEDG